MNQPVKIAVVQMNAQTGKIDMNMKKIVEKADEAAEKGARLIVFPELICQGCEFDNAETMILSAQKVPEGSCIQTLIQKSVQKGIYIVAGLNEIENGKFYNTAVLTGPQGYIGKYQKVHLFDEERMTKEGGETGFPVFYTDIGRIGLLVCYDLWFPESVRILTLKGAELICIPTAWVPVPAPVPKGEKRPMANLLIMAQSHMNGIYMAAADRAGNENGTQWLGKSMITDTSGWPLASCDEKSEEIIYAEVDLRSVRTKRRLGEDAHLIYDRRTDIYGIVCQDRRL